MNNLKEVLERYYITTKDKKTIILQRNDERKDETSKVVQLDLLLD
ncbi:hypothetical protein [Terribacillus saccharophilus]|nr:hypothetical protein [Terribacillus saccharophilus]